MFEQGLNVSNRGDPESKNVLWTRIPFNPCPKHVFQTEICDFSVQEFSVQDFSVQDFSVRDFDIVKDGWSAEVDADAVEHLVYINSEGEGRLGDGVNANTDVLAIGHECTAKGTSCAVGGGEGDSAEERSMRRRKADGVDGDQDAFSLFLCHPRATAIDIARVRIPALHVGIF